MKKLSTRIISITLAVLLLVNNVSFALSPQPGSRSPGTQEGMYALGQKLFAAKRGPGGDWLSTLFNKLQLRNFVGHAHLSDTVFFKKADYNALPEGWKNNPILQKTDLIEALRYFRDNEARIPTHSLKVDTNVTENAGYTYIDLHPKLIPTTLLDIKEGYFKLEKGKEGELPIARIEKTKVDGDKVKYTLIIHTEFVQMWNHIRKNDVWFKYIFPDGCRIVSLAWGIFYRLAKHEMTDLEKKNLLSKGGGHISLSLDTIQAREIIGDIPEAIMSPDVQENLGGKIAVNKNEKDANKAGAKYDLVNDAIWLWFLASYCFNDATRYNNNTLKRRIDWIFTSEKAKAMGLPDEFPNIADSFERGGIVPMVRASNLALAINYHFFSRRGIEVPELVVDQKFIDEYEKREPYIIGKPLYATGRDEGVETSRQAETAKSRAKAGKQEFLTIEDINNGFKRPRGLHQLARLHSIAAQDKNYAVCIYTLLPKGEGKVYFTVIYDKKKRKMAGKSSILKLSTVPSVKIYAEQRLIEINEVKNKKGLFVYDTNEKKEVLNEHICLKNIDVGLPHYAPRQVMKITPILAGKNRYVVAVEEQAGSSLVTFVIVYRLDTRKFEVLARMGKEGVKCKMLSENYLCLKSGYTGNISLVVGDIRNMKEVLKEKSTEGEPTYQNGKLTVFKKDSYGLVYQEIHNLKTGEVEKVYDSDKKPRTRPGKSSADLLKLIARYMKADDTISTPKLLKLYQEHYKALGFEAPAKKRSSALQTIRRDLRQLRKQKLVMYVGKKLTGVYLFELTAKGHKAAPTYFSFDEQVKIAKEFLKENGLVNLHLTVNEENQTLSLNLAYNNITNIDALKNLPNLTKLNLGLTNITNIDALKELTNLTKLDLAVTDITNKQIYELFRNNDNRKNLEVINPVGKTIKYSDIPDEYKQPARKVTAAKTIKKALLMIPAIAAINAVIATVALAAQNTSTEQELKRFFSPVELALVVSMAVVITTVACVVGVAAGITLIKKYEEGNKNLFRERDKAKRAEKIGPSTRPGDVPDGGEDGRAFARKVPFMSVDELVTYIMESSRGSVQLGIVIQELGKSKLSDFTEDLTTALRSEKPKDPRLTEDLLLNILSVAQNVKLGEVVTLEDIKERFKRPRGLYRAKPVSIAVQNADYIVCVYQKIIKTSGRPIWFIVVYDSKTKQKASFQKNILESYKKPIVKLYSRRQLIEIRSHSGANEILTIFDIKTGKNIIDDALRAIGYVDNKCCIVQTAHYADRDMRFENRGLVIFDIYYLKERKMRQIKTYGHLWKILEWPFLYVTNDDADTHRTNYIYNLSSFNEDDEPELVVSWEGNAPWRYKDGTIIHTGTNRFGDKYVSRRTKLTRASVPAKIGPSTRPGKSPADALAKIIGRSKLLQKGPFTLKMYLAEYKRIAKDYGDIEPLSFHPSQTARNDLYVKGIKNQMSLVTQGILRELPEKTKRQELQFELTSNGRNLINATKGFIDAAMVILSNLEIQALDPLVEIDGPEEKIIVSNPNNANEKIEFIVTSDGRLHRTTFYLEVTHGEDTWATSTGILPFFEVGVRDILSKMKNKAIWKKWAKAAVALKLEDNVDSRQHPLITIISEFALKIGVDIGPGSELKLTQDQTQAVWEAVNLFHENRIEILVPQQLKLTDDMNKALRDIKKRGGAQTISCRQYTDSNIVMILARKEKGVKRIIIATEDTKEAISDLAILNPEIFNGERLLNIELPENYNKMEYNEKTVHQARIMMIAIFGRLLQGEKTPFIKAILMDMLKPHLAKDIDANEFVERLGELEDMHTHPGEVRQRVLYFLHKAVSLVERLGEELKFLKEFWTYA